MELPYSAEVYFAALAEYNRATFPAAVLAPALALLAFILALIAPPAGRDRRSTRTIALLLAAAWAWVGWAHQLRHMAELNFMAPVYGAAWLAEGALLAVVAVGPRALVFRFGRDLRGLFGLAVALCGLVGYPLALLALGQDWRALALAGTAPNPTVLFTVGLLLAARPRPPAHLFVIPAGWAIAATAAALLLEFPLDYAVGAAVLSATATGATASCRARARSRRRKSAWQRRRRLGTRGQRRGDGAEDGPR